MNRYTIYCTEEQTKKALELGAPIKTQQYVGGQLCENWFADNNVCYHRPTAEQMIGWLEEQKEIRCVEVTESFGWHYRVKKKHDDVDNWIQGTCHSRKEATNAAIDAALEYLSNKK